MFVPIKVYIYIYRKNFSIRFHFDCKIVIIQYCTIINKDLSVSNYSVNVHSIIIYYSLSVAKRISIKRLITIHTNNYILTYF